MLTIRGEEPRYVVDNKCLHKAKSLIISKLTINSILNLKKLNFIHLQMESQLRNMNFLIKLFWVMRKIFLMIIIIIMIIK